MKERIEELAGKVCFEVISMDMAANVITTAVNEALEMAARECDQVAENHWPGLDAGASDKCAAAIRKLKLNGDWHAKI